MNKVNYLFDSNGRWIAFEKEGYIFTPTGEWIGWVPNKSRDVVDLKGKYLGTIVDNRLFKKVLPPPLIPPGYPGFPRLPGFPGFPKFETFRFPPPGMKDVEQLKDNK